MTRWNWIIPLLTACGVVALTWAASQARIKELPVGDESVAVSDITATVERVESELQQRWEAAGMRPAAPADDLTVLRRLSLALQGTIPSLEEIRLFEADTRADRLDRWTAAMLEDDRFHRYFAERLARAFVGVENGQFILFRRDRLLDWLQQQLREQTPYDQIVREMIQGTGVWTGEGEVNFITRGFSDGDFDANVLTARSTRAFLGQRIDCAQCHDHPFDHWKQTEFQGLAAHFGQVEISPLGGLIDKKKKEFQIEDALSGEKETVAPAVPFHPEWLGETGSRRERLARWMTHPENERFEIAIANRIWGLMFGRPYLANRPVDDLPDPGTDERLRLLQILGNDFREHDCDLRRLIRVIAASDVFRMQSRHPLDNAGDETKSDKHAEQLEQLRESWAVFPLIRLRPEQVIGGMLQARSVRTVDLDSHLFVRMQRYFGERDFVNEYGDLGSNELQDSPGTIPQALLRMNSKFSHELTEANPLSSPGGISALSDRPRQAIELAFLCCLTRRPTESELAGFEPWFVSPGKRKSAVEDLYWTLFNSPEFSWNH